MLGPFKNCSMPSHREPARWPYSSFAKEFLDDFAKLEPAVRQKVRELPDKFEHSVQTGVHLEKLTGARDNRVRTVRVDRFWRGVVVRLGKARYALLRVLAHDKANAWATRQQFGVNPVTGLVEILDIPTVETKVQAVTATATAEATSLFEDRRDRDFTAVGIEEELVPILRRIVDEAELYAIANYLPDAQGDAALLLADGKDDRRKSGRNWPTTTTSAVGKSTPMTSTQPSGSLVPSRTSL